jgi:hypothetical protein
VSEREHKIAGVVGSVRAPTLADVLDEIEATFRRFVVFPTEHEPVALALVVAHAHAIDAADVTPYVHITSPERRSGKTRTLEVAAPLMPEAERLIVPTAAAIYGLLDVGEDERAPALLFDEVDNYLQGKAATAETGQILLGVLNDGYYRGGSVPRVEFVGKRRTIRRFPTFGVKVFTGRATLPDTLADRCLPIRLQRRRRDERVDAFRRREVLPQLGRIRDRLAVLVTPKMIARLEAARPKVPEVLEDRQADLWEPLLAIADAASDRWPERARATAVALHAAGAAADESLGLALLWDGARVLAATSTGELSTVDLARQLVELDDASGPWAEDWDRSLNARAVGHRIARLLRPFGIESQRIRLADGSQVRGYVVAAFVEPLERYPYPYSRRNVTTSHVPPKTAAELRRDVVTLPTGKGGGDVVRDDPPPDDETALENVRQILGAVPEPPEAS